jgi:hypothetical protein
MELAFLMLAFVALLKGQEAKALNLVYIPPDEPLLSALMEV